MEQCNGILQSSLTDEIKIANGMQCKDEAIDLKSCIMTNYDAENTRNIKTTFSNIETDKLLDNDSKDELSSEQFHRNLSTKAASPYFKTKQFLNDLVYSQPDESKTICETKNKQLKTDPSIQTKPCARILATRIKDELMHCKQQTMFHDTSVPVNISYDSKLSNDNMNGSCDNSSCSTIVNQNYYQSVQKCISPHQTIDKTEDKYKQDNIFVQFNEITSSMPCTNKPVNDCQSTSKIICEDNSVHMNEMTGCTTVYTKNYQILSKELGEGKIVKQDFNNEIPSKDEHLFEEKTINSIEDLTNQEHYLQHFKNSKHEIVEETTLAKSTCNFLSKENVSNLETKAIICCHEIIDNCTQSHPLSSNMSVDIYNYHTCSSLCKQKTSNISNISSVEKICKPSVNDFDMNSSATITDTGIRSNQLATAIKNIHSGNRKGCSSLSQNICERNAVLSPLCKEKVKSTSVTSLKISFNSNTTEFMTTLPSAVDTLDDSTKNKNLALAIKNIRTGKKTGCNVSQNSLIGSSKNDIVIFDKMNGNTDEVSNKNSVESSKILSNKSITEALDKYEILNNSSNPPSLPEEILVITSMMDEEPIQHTILSYESLSCDSDTRKAIQNNLQLSNELEQHQRKQDDTLSSTNSVTDAKVLEHNCLSIHINENKNFKETNINMLDAEKSITFQNSAQLKNEGKSHPDNMVPKNNSDAALTSKEKSTMPNSIYTPSLNNSATLSAVQGNVENVSSENCLNEEVCKNISADSISEHKAKKAETVQSLFDIQVSNYLFPRSEDLFSSKMDVWNGIVWERADIKCVLYHGNQIIPPMETVASGPFTIPLIKRLQELSFPGPTCMQKLVWPAVFRGHNVITIAPARSGKSLAYLLPIASLLTHQGQYDESVGSVGPLAVILCSNWKKAQTVYNQSKLLLQNCDIDVNVAYSGGYESSKKFALLSGCKILIITPPSYLRMHKQDKRIANMNHCCHLVFDDADRIIDKFLTEVSKIMNEFVDAVSCRKESLLPNQIILCSEHWSKHISSFVYNCIPNPLIVMISFDEAAIYAQVPTFCHIRPVSTPSLVMKLVTACKTKRAIISTCYVETAMKIYKLLCSVAPKTLMAHGNLTEQEINKISKEWQQYCNVEESIMLIATDDVILQLDIKNANCLVHYDLPKLPNFYFGLRYSFMVNNFCTLEKIFLGNISDCVCHIFITKSCQILSNSLLKFLRQLPCEIPDSLTSLAEKFKEEKEYKNVHLCHHFKAYGFCPSHRTCSYRHRIDQDLDSVTYVPRYGPVKIFITNVIDATHYYARIVEHNDSCCTLNCISYLSLSLKMSDYYNISTNHVHPTEIKVHTLYALQKADNTFHRIWVTRISSCDTTGSPQNIFIYYVDEGWYEKIISEKLLVLPPDLAKLPAQAIEIYACSVQPIDKCYEWTPQSSMFIRDMINGKEVEGNVVLGLHSTLWLEPIVYYVQIKLSNITVVQAVISDIIIKEEFGIKNPNHLPKLYNACDKVTKLPDYETNLNAFEQQHAFLELNKFHDIYIYSVRSPDLFFVQRTDFIDCMDSVSDELDKMIRKGMLKKPKRIVKDMICAAPFNGENSWYRATVNYVDINNSQVDLFFVDYGDTNVAKIEDIYCIPSELLLLPFQAIECSLAGVLPSAHNWTCEAGKLLYDLSSNETTTKKMVVKALKSEISRFRKGKRYVIQLWDTTLDYDIYIADELVKQGMALPCNLPNTLENDQQVLLKQLEIDELLPEEENCEKTFLAAVIYGQINEKIDDLIENVNNKKKAECHDFKPDSVARSTAAATDNSAKCLIPEVQWCQTDKTISIQISVANLTKYEMNIVGLHVCFVATVGDNMYQFKEELFDFVQSETCDVKAIGTSTLFIFLKKEIGKWWPQLTKFANKNVKVLEMKDKKDSIENTESEISMQMPIIKWDSQDILPYDPCDEYEKENLSEDDVPWEQVCLPLDPYDMICWD